VYAKRFFYRAVVYLSSSKFAILAVGNMALVSFLLAWRVIQTIFLGPLRFREVERLHLRARDAIIECCFALTIFREEFNARFLALVTTLLLLKSLHWLCKDRVEFLEEQPLTPTSGHVRLVGLMALLFAIDARLVVSCSLYTFRAPGATMLVLFAFEFTVLLIDLVSNVVRYVLHVVDLYLDSRWDAKGLYSFYNELLSDMCQLTVYVAFFIYVQFFYTFPLHIIRDLYVTFTKFQRRCADFLRYRRVATMNELFADATEEELAAGDRTCIICREEMRAAKKLHCGHMFHVRCLQSWLTRQPSCPTCRSAVDVSETATLAGAGAAPQVPANPAAAAAPAGAPAGVPAAAPAVAADNNARGLPPWVGALNQGPPGGPHAPQRRPDQNDGGIIGTVNAWWQALAAAAAPRNGAQPPRPDAMAHGYPYALYRPYGAPPPPPYHAHPGHAPHAQHPHQPPHAPPARAQHTQHAHPPAHPEHQPPTAHPAHPAHPLHRFYYHPPLARLVRRQVVLQPGHVVPPQAAAPQTGGGRPAAAPPAAGSPPPPAATVPHDDTAAHARTYYANSVYARAVTQANAAPLPLDRLLHLQESIELIAATVNRIEPVIGTLRTQVRDAVLAATVPPAAAALGPASQPAASAPPPAPASAFASAYGSGSAPAPVHAPAPATTRPSVSLPEPVPAAAAGSTPEPAPEVPPSCASSPRNAMPAAGEAGAADNSEASQLRERRLQFLARANSGGSGDACAGHGADGAAGDAE
jgi:Ring finger domain